MTSGPILILVGTNRPDSSALKVARVIQGHYLSLSVGCELLSLQDLPLEVYAPSAYASKPAGFAPFQQRVLSSVGLHLVIPEYNGSFPGAIKYFIDLLKFPESFDRRPVAFVGEANGSTGALRAVEQLQLVFGYRNAYVYPERVFIPAVKERFDADGRLVDTALNDRLHRQARGFARFIACVGGG